jgi:hypothetical protein
MGLSCVSSGASRDDRRLVALHLTAIGSLGGVQEAVETVVAVRPNSANRRYNARLGSGAGSSATTPASACRGRPTRRREAGSLRSTGLAAREARDLVLVEREVVPDEVLAVVGPGKGRGDEEGCVSEADHPVFGAANETRTYSSPAQCQRST